ncbi:MAG TPA: hypothetical protein DCZ10_16115 [Pelotomaculum sp.]|nr:hypothetical protein [Pelotomaculum sp.]
MAFPNINTIPPITGRKIKENGTVVNTAEMVEALYNALVTNKNAGVETSFLNGVATGGSKTSIVDSGKNFEADILVGGIAEMIIDGVTYYRSISANMGNAITISALPGASASVVVGDHAGAEVTITFDEEGAAANEYMLEIVNGEGENVPLSADFTDGILTVTLATDETGAPDNAENTATAVAGVIDILDGFSAVMTGSGGVMAVTAEPVPFTGGIDTVEVASETPYFLKRKLSLAETVA